MDFSVVEPKKKHKVVVPRHSTTSLKFAAKLQGRRQVPFWYPVRGLYPLFGILYTVCIPSLAMFGFSKSAVFYPGFQKLEPNRIGAITFLLPSPLRFR
jgi:hypothetical protein